MTRVDFYILGYEQLEQRLQFSYKLAEKAYLNGHRVYIDAPDEAATAIIDDGLWKFRADSFVPHQVVKDNDVQHTPIEIGSGADPIEHHDFLINLSNHLPDYFSRFKRVAEIVIQDPEVLKSTRSSYSYYQERGYPMHTHDLRSKQTSAH